MNMICNICDYPLKDGDDVVAIMVAKYKMLDSNAIYAIGHPTRCVEIVHSECFDWDDYEDENADE
jgi:hypothetical protein